MSLLLPCRMTCSSCGCGHATKRHSSRQVMFKCPLRRRFPRGSRCAAGLVTCTLRILLHRQRLHRAYHSEVEACGVGRGKERARSTKLHQCLCALVSASRCVSASLLPPCLRHGVLILWLLCLHLYDKPLGGSGSQRGQIWRSWFPSERGCTLRVLGKLVMMRLACEHFGCPVAQQVTGHSLRCHTRSVAQAIGNRHAPASVRRVH